MEATLCFYTESPLVEITRKSYKILLLLYLGGNWSPLFFFPGQIYVKANIIAGLFGIPVHIYFDLVDVLIFMTTASCTIDCMQKIIRQEFPKCFYYTLVYIFVVSGFIRTTLVPTESAAQTWDRTNFFCCLATPPISQILSDQNIYIRHWK